MSGLVAAVRCRVPDRCLARRCRRENCSVSLAGAPTEHLFVGEEAETARVVPIELKSGGFRAADVAEQLRGGAALAASWLPEDSAFSFVPVLAHGKRIHKRELKKLRSEKIRLRGQARQIVPIHCGQPLRGALRPEVT